MSDQKISELTAITGANTADDDLLVIVDTSTGETKKITLAELEAGIARGDMTFGDNQKAIFGAGGDLQIYHDGGNNNTYIRESGTGNLLIEGDDLYLANAADTQFYLSASNGGAVTAYYNGSAKLATTATGIDVTGTVIADGGDFSGQVQFNGTAGIQLDNGAQVHTWTLDDNFTSRLNIGTSSASAAWKIGSNSTAYLTVSPTGIDVTGTATMDGLTVDNNAVFGGITLNGANAPALKLNDTTDNAYCYIATNNGGRLLLQADAGNIATGSAIELEVDGKEFLKIDSTGDISFYEDTGTTAKFFWDASAESLGIGTASPTGAMHLNGTANNTFLKVTNTANSTGFFAGVRGTAYGTIFSADDGYIYQGNGKNLSMTADGGGVVRFGTGSTERMRITSAGDVLVGGTNTTPWSNNTGSTADNEMALRADGILAVSAYKNTVNSGNVILANRTGTDGPIQSFYKDGTTVGSIGNSGNDFYVTGSVINIAGTYFANSKVLPMKSGALSDAATDLGQSTNRFKDLYLSGGVYVGGTGAANYLDEYEEGTWTPVIADASSGGNSTTPSSSSNTYTKVGRQVFVKAVIANINTTGLTAGNNLYIRGLPFTANDTANGTVKVDAVTFSGNYLTCEAASSNLVIHDVTSNSGDTLLTVGALNSTFADIFVSITYTTA